MQHRKIKAEKEQDLFSQHYQKLAGLPVGGDYIRSASLFAFFDREGRMIAGYALHRGAPRCFGFIGDADLRARLEREFPADRTLEVTCLWVDPKIHSLKSRVGIYLWMYIDVMSRRPEFLISGSAIPTLQRLHMLMLKRALFNDHWQGTAKTGLVYGDRTRGLTGRFVKALGLYIWRKLRKPGARSTKGSKVLTFPANAKNLKFGRGERVMDVRTSNGGTSHVTAEI